MKLNKKFKPLFDLPKGVRYFVMTGGRLSQKSYAVSTAAVDLALKNHRILYTRYTLTATEDSIIPEFTEKIDLLGFTDKFHSTKDRIESTFNKSKIVFKGIRTSSGNQTAKLKSLKDFSCFILDEAEEENDEDSFDKIDLSIRANDVPNVIMLILNPTVKSHWIYERFFLDKNVQPGFNGIKDNVCYIHTSYLDCVEFVPDDIIAQYEYMKEHFPNKYENIVMGGWLDNTENAIVKKEWFIIDTKVNEELRKIVFIDGAYTNDKKNDPTGILVTSFDGNFITVHNYITRWYTLAELLSNFKQISDENNLSNRDEIKIEPKASGKDLVSMLNSMFTIPANDIKTDFVKVSKTERIETSAPYIQQGKVILKKGNWNDAFINEVCTFPNAKHDEAVDLISYAIEHYLISRGVFMINV